MINSLGSVRRSYFQAREKRRLGPRIGIAVVYGVVGPERKASRCVGSKTL